MQFFSASHAFDLPNLQSAVFAAGADLPAVCTPAHAVHGADVAVHVLETVAVLAVVDAHALVEGHGGDETAVGAESAHVDRLLVAVHPVHQQVACSLVLDALVVQLPEHDLEVVTARNKAFTILIGQFVESLLCQIHLHFVCKIFNFFDALFSD